MYSISSSTVITSVVLVGIASVVSVSGENDSVELGDYNFLKQIWIDREIYQSSISNVLTRYFKFGNLTENVAKCYESLQEMTTAAFNREEWALLMFDAIGKPGSGILDGNVIWAGNYRECLDVNNGKTSGRYCWMETPLNTNSSDWNHIYFKITRKALRIGVCVPHICDKKELEELIAITKRGIQDIFGYKEQIDPLINVKCINSPPVILKDDPVALTAIGVCCIFVFLMVSGTVLDLQTRNRMKKHEKLVMSIEKQNGYVNNKFVDYNQNGNYVHIAPKSDFEMAENNDEPSKFVLFLICFSVYTNGKQLFSLKHSNNSVPELNGLKAISASVVIFGHTYLYTWRIVDNPLEMGEVMTHWYMQFPANFYYFVDIFLVITGFLTMQVVLKLFVATGRSCNLSFIMSYIFHRYWRLTTTYSLILLVLNIGLNPHLATGPFWRDMQPYCRSDWWKNLLYISNWWPMEQQCYATSWYMSLCMQFHLITLLIIIPLFYKRYRLLSVINGCLILIMSWCWVGWLSYKHDLAPSYSQINRKDISNYLEKMRLFKDLMYMTPFYHSGSYIAGLATGWILHEYNNQIILSKKQVTVGWIMCCVLGLGTVHLMYFNPNPMVKSLHMALSITVWSICISWIILACNTGNGGFIRSLLSWKCWLPLSKLALTIYLIQATIIDYMSHTEMVPLHFSEYNFFGLFLRHWLVSVVLAIPFSLAFEAPVFAIEKFIINHILERKDSTRFKTV